MKAKFRTSKTERYFKCFVIALMLLCGKLHAQEVKGCCASIYTTDSLQKVSLTDLSREYRRLKHKRCEECNSWARSGLFEVMTELGNRLEGKSRVDIRKAMGKADEKEANKWIYDWRNGHDYLFFEFTDGRAKAQWYYAYE